MKTRFFQTCLGVFQGGGCRAAAFAGAYAEARRWGVTFSEVAGTSAGSIVAALVAARATPEQILDLVTKLDYKKFLHKREASLAFRPRIVGTFLRVVPLRALHVWMDKGMYSSVEIERWVEDALRDLLKQRSPVLFSDLPLPLHVVASDIRRRQVKVWSAEETPDDSVARAVRASCSIPLFFQPVGDHVDGGLLSNLPTFVFGLNRASNVPLASKVLAFSLEDSERQQSAVGTSDFFNQLAETLVDGSRELQLRVKPGTGLVRIRTEGVRSTDFQTMTTEHTAALVESGRAATEAFFREEPYHVRSEVNEDSLLRRDEVWTIAMENIHRPVTRIVICSQKLDWAFSIFPALAYWRSQGCSVAAIVPRNGADQERGGRQKRVLRNLGVELIELEGGPQFSALLFLEREIEDSRAVVVSDDFDGEYGVRYRGSVHASAIRALLLQISQVMGERIPEEARVPHLEAMRDDELVSMMRSVTHYASAAVKVEIRSVDLSDVWCLARTVPEFKFRQTECLEQLYAAAELELFHPARLVMLDGRGSPVLPPVLENSGGRLCTILGASRLTYCRDRGIARVKALVVEGVTQPLPAKNPVRLERVRIVARGMSREQRYDDFLPELFRPIERSVRRDANRDAGYFGSSGA